MQLLKFNDEQEVRNVVLDLAQKRRQVIYGQQSVNIQLPPKFRRETKDYDILTKRPKKMAEELAKRLNLKYGEGEYKVEPAKYGKTFKVKSKEGKTIADYTLTTKKPKTKEVWGVRYAQLPYQEKKLKRILKDEMSQFRHDKDRDTLEKIRGGKLRW
jgi:hypothetical protein